MGTIKLKNKSDIEIKSDFAKYNSNLDSFSSNSPWIESKYRLFFDKNNKDSFQVTGAHDLKKMWFKGKNNVGISAGASTPDYLIEEVTKRIKNYDMESSNG